MKRNINRLGASSFVLAALGTLIIGGPAVAQQADDDVVIQSQRGFVRASLSADSAQLLTIKRRVSYTDLDLATNSGAQQLEARVRSTARAICDKLDRMDPLSAINAGACVRDAVTTGMIEARAAIAAAKKSTRTAAIGSVE